MATGSFYYPDPPPGTVTAQSNGPWNLGTQVVVSAPGGNVVGVRFWKQALDTGTHTATVYTSPGAALLGSQAFAGETASGWQSLTFTTPIAVAAGTYRVCVNHTTVNYSSISPQVSKSSGIYTVGVGGDWGIAGSGTGYPSTAFSTFGFLIDPIVDGLPASQARSSQVLGETWVSNPGAVWMSQATVEAWYKQIPITAVVVSQAVAEVWMPSPVALVGLRRATMAQVV